MKHAKLLVETSGWVVGTLHVRACIEAAKLNGTWRGCRLGGPTRWQPQCVNLMATRWLGAPLEDVHSRFLRQGN